MQLLQEFAASPRVWDAGMAASIEVELLSIKIDELPPAIVTWQASFFLSAEESRANPWPRQ